MQYKVNVNLSADHTTVIWFASNDLLAACFYYLLYVDQAVDVLLPAC